MKTFKILLLACLFLFSIENNSAQNCESVATWEDEMIDEPLQMAAQFGGYYAIAGNPTFVEENCTPGGSVGLSIKAGIDGAVGDVVGYTTQIGINPSPTFLNGVTYNISGKKLYTENSTGTYSDLTMTITLVNGAGGIQVVNKSLMLIQGQCDSWDPPQAFVSPGDFDLAEIAITASNGTGEDDLFIVIDDWCIEEVVNECFAEFGYQQIDECGGVQLMPNISGGTFDSWQISGPNGFSNSSNTENLVIGLPFAGTYIIDIAIICEDGTLQVFQQSITVDFFDEGPIFEACDEGSTEQIIGISIDGECTAEYILPDLMPFDDSGVFSVVCFLDSSIPVTAGQTVSLSGGTHQVFCNIIDECENETSCLYYIDVICEGEEPCDYICCEGEPNWPVEGYPLGSLPQSVPTGYYPEYGDPQVVADGCEDSSQGLSLNGVTLGYGGDAAGLRNNGTPPVSLFEEGKTYCISYCMKVEGGNTPSAMLTLQASNVSQSDFSCAGSCESIGQSRLVLASEGWVTVQNIYTPTTNFDNFILLNNDTGFLDFPSTVLFDNVCITENPEPIACKVDIIIEELECGKVVVNTEVCGELEEITILYDDGFESFAVEDTTVCIDYPSAGPWTIDVTYTCADGTTKTTSKTFTLENNVGAPEIFCPNDTTIIVTPDGGCTGEYFLGNYTVSDPSATVKCYFTGDLVDPSVPIILAPGGAIIEYIATNECGADTCQYILEVICQDCEGPCEDYNESGSSANWIRYNINGSNVTRTPVNLANKGPGDEYLDGQDVSGGTYIYNNVDFSGDYTDLTDCCMCFDYKYIDDASQSTAGRTYMAIYQGPEDAPTLLATFITNNNVSSNDPWQTFCANFTPCVGGVLPSNADGFWRMSVGSGCADWNALISNVSGIRFPLDLNGNPDEVHGYDNICWKSCPENPCDSLLFAIDTLGQNPNGGDGCCYSLDIEIDTALQSVDIVSFSKDVIFNTLQINDPDYSFALDPSGKKISISKNSGLIPVGQLNNIIDFCLSMSDESPTPQYFEIVFNISEEVECHKSFLLNCIPPPEVDPCAESIAEATCQDGYYDLDITVSNVSAIPPFSAYKANFTSCDSSILFRPDGTSFTPGFSIGANLIPDLGPNDPPQTVRVEIVPQVPITVPTMFCFETTIWNDAMCCTTPDKTCVTLFPCCNPCDSSFVTITDYQVVDSITVSIKPGSSMDDAHYSSCQVGGIWSDHTSLALGAAWGGASDGCFSQSYLQFPFDDVCPDAVIKSAKLKLFGDPLSTGHVNTTSLTSGCAKVKRITSSWTESGPVLPTNTSTNEVVIPLPISTYQDFDIDVTALVQDMFANPSNSFGFNLESWNCGLDLLYVFASGENSNSALWPELVIEYETQSCETEDAGCCHSVDVKVGCEEDYFTKLELEMITPGVVIGSHSTGSSIPSDWTNPISTNTKIVWEHTSGSIPVGDYTSLMNFCLDDIDAGEQPQELLLRWITKDGSGQDSIACLDTLRFDCIPVVDSCIGVIDLTAKNSLCDTCFVEPFCNEWLLDKATWLANNAGSSFTIPDKIETGTWNGQTVYIISTNLDLHASETVYGCAGNVIQACADGFFPTTCNPDQGIDLNTDIVGKALIWDLTMPAPVAPSTCTPLPLPSSIDYCLTFKNLSPTGHTASQILVRSLTSGITIWPDPINLPGGLPAGGIATVDFNLSGNVNPGDTVKIVMRLHDHLSGLDWCCFEGDTLCIVIPTCPPVEDCCDIDDEEFDQVFNQLLNSVINQDFCEICWNAETLDSCDYLEIRVDNQPWTVVNSNEYCQVWTDNKSHNVCMKLTRWKDGQIGVGEPCMVRDTCIEYIVECDPCQDDLSCDDLSISTSLNANLGLCCYDVSIDNNYCNDYFKGIRVSLSSASISSVIANSGWAINQLDNFNADISPIAGSFIPLGSGLPFSICNTSSSNYTMVISWLVDDGNGGCLEVCPEDFVLEECEIDPKSCYEFIQDSIHCESNTYCFKIKNTSAPAFDLYSVHLFDLTGNLVLSPSGRMNIPNSPIASGQTSDWICVQYSNVIAGDSVCYKLSAHNQPVGTPPTECCTDTIETCFVIPECDTTSSDCFTIVDIEAKSIVCDAPDCYGDPFCQAWLVAKINGYTYYPPSTAIMQKAIYNGRTVFIWRETFIDGSHYEIYECSGMLIQDCWQFFPGPQNCSLDAGIDLTTDVSSVQLVWDVNTPYPTYDPSICIGASTNTVVDYCVKIMNNSPAGYLANQINLNAIVPTGITITPSVHNQNIPSGGMGTINFTVAGNLTAGDIVKVEGLLSGNDPMEEPWECVDTICLEIPSCPIDSCCSNEDDFLNNVAQGFQITNLGDCTYQVCANQFDTCHWFPNLGPDWGDGSFLLPAVLQSNPPNNCWTHKYTTNGTFKISLPVSEGTSIDSSCWSGTVCGEVIAECCDEDPCDDVDVSISQLSTDQDSCCTLFTIDNNFCSDYFKGIRVEMTAPATVSQISALNGYVVNQITPQVAEVKPLFGFVSVGVRDAFILCSTGYTTNPHQVAVSWLVPGLGDTCIAECEFLFDIGCDTIPTPDKCYTFVSDSIHCESNTYCFKIKNTSSPAFDINSVQLYDPSGTLGLTPNGRMNIPTLTSGMTSDWICVNYFGVTPGDNACFKISAHNKPVGQAPTTCCTDTLDVCFSVPDCPMEVCGTCPDGSTAGPNLVSNGNFNLGYSGFASGYNQRLSGIMATAEYSIRNSTNLDNTQWKATDHTAGDPIGDFLVINGPSANVAYSTSVITKPNTDYVFCMWVDNLVCTSTPSDPVIEVKINGTVVEAGRWLPKNPDGWQLITLNYNSGSNVSTVIDVTDIAGVQYNDWAIDDVSFRECGPVVDLCCDDLDEQAIVDYYNANIIAVNNECEGCVTVDIDSCDLAYIDFGNGEIQLSDLTPICQPYDTSGTFGFTIRIERLNVNGDVCFEEEFQGLFDIECPPVDDCCDDLDEQAIVDYYDLNIVIANGDCEGCVTIDLDSCDIAEVDFGNGPVSIGDGETLCQSFTTGGSYPFSVKITRLNVNGDSCFEKTFDLVFDIEGCVPDPDPCCDNLDIAALDAYYLSNTTFDTSGCVACVIVDLDSCDVGTVTFSGGATQTLQDNTQSCMTYAASGNYSYIVDIVRYNTNGDTCYHYQSNNVFDLVCDGDPPVYPCVHVVADSINCETNTYCFRVRNNTVPGWTIRSLAFVNESAGHTLTPDPISIAPLAVGDTTDWICVDYIALTGDTVCFNLVAHQEDLGAGDEPQFCCSNPEPVCFVVPECDMCTMCPDSTIQGPNLVMNADFEGGYTGFTSDYVQSTSGIMATGEYSIRNSTTLDNTQWTGVDHTTGTASGNFLILNGPDPNIAYRTMVSVDPNTNYVFCVYAINLVNSSVNSTPSLTIDVDGVSQLIGVNIPKQGGQWQILTFSYFSGSNSGLVPIEIRDIDPLQFNDWAIDDISFRECMVEKICCDNEDEFYDLLDLGWMVSQNGCSVTVTAPQLDSCHWISQSEPDWGDGNIAGQVITPAIGSWSHIYDAGGSYTICATVFEGDNPDDICFSGEMCTEVELLDCPMNPDPCNATEVTIFNAMTPNGDGLNDRLVVTGGSNCMKNIKIFNRWGQEVWAQLNYQNDWTGQSFSGEKLPDGTYFLVLEFPELTDDKLRMKQTYIELRN